MIRNYFLSAWRNLWRNKYFAFIKVAGLAIGLSCCMLILLYTKDEISYDRFHQNSAQLYRIIQTFQFENRPEQVIGVTNGIVGDTYAKEIPEVLQRVRVNGYSITIRKNNDVFNENSLIVDDNYFTVFTCPLLEGNKRTALADPYSMVLSKNMALKYFGTTDVVGKTMQIKLDTAFETFIISAIAANSPENSTLKADMYLPYSFFKKYNSNTEWFGGSLNTFVLLTPKNDLAITTAKMQSIFDTNTKSLIEKAKKEQGISVKIKLGLQPLTNIHLGDPAGPDNGMADGSKPEYSYILSCIALFILIIACINFINLSVAQSLRRSKEIGVRKVVGGTRKQLIWQFLIESFLVSLIAFFIATALTIFLLPYFNELANKKLDIAYLADGYLYAGFILLLLFTSLIAGSYPSLVLSSFQPVKVLYNRIKLGGKNYLTKSLIVLQFALAIFLIIGTIAIRSQVKYLMTADPGYENKDLIKLNIPINKTSDQLPTLFKNELSGRENIVSVTSRNRGRSISGVKANGKQIDIENTKIDENFLSTFKIPLIAGRNFSTAFTGDSLQSIIVNERLVKEAGWNPSEAIGKTLSFGESHNGRQVTIVGVIRDYHFSSFKEKIMAQVLTMDPEFNIGEIWVKIKPGDIPKTLALLSSTYKKLIPYFPYSYQFIEDSNARNYENESKWSLIFSIASGMFIFISCMGLLGLIMLTIEHRTKEIGIRKVLGAAVSRIVILLSREFVVLITISFLIAAPPGYYFVNKWLRDFAYKTDIHLWNFVLAGMIVLGFALLTIGFHAIKAATANPIKNLHTE